MKILIVGGGGREHAIGFKLKKDNDKLELYFTPGNGGTHSIGTNVNISDQDIPALVNFATSMNMDLTIVGPEVPLGLGIVDEFEKNKLKIFGPDKRAAKLETSKVFSKEFMIKYNVPTAKYNSFSNSKSATTGLENYSFPIVIKADGLAAGKGVYICQNIDEANNVIHEIMHDKIFGDSGNRIIIEEFLVGKEISLLCFVDGKTILPMEGARDYKKIFDNDIGANTGGMGCVSPVDYFDKNHEDVKIILKNTLAGIQKENFNYKGMLFIGLMQTSNGMKVIEYNVRFGDPESEVLLPRLKCNLLEIILNTVEQKLDETLLTWDKRYCVGVFLTSGGYPEKYITGREITIKENEKNENVFIFHSGTVINNDKLVTNGGRVTIVSALGNTREEARGLAYKTMDKIDFSGKYYRTDIGRD